MFDRLKCMMGKHERSRSKARSTSRGWVSICKRCGAQLRRSPERKWIVDDHY